MNKNIAILLLLGVTTLTACKETTPTATNKEKEPEVPMIQAQGCSVLKTKGVLKVKCADGSEAEGGAPQFHIRDAIGTDLDDLVFLQNWGTAGVVAINKNSGNVLGYSASGNVTSLTKTFYTTNNCTGPAYAFFSDFVIKNKVIANNGGAPNTVEALRIVGFTSATTVFASKYEAGACALFAGSNSNASIVEPTEFDDSDPLSISLPIEIVLNQ